MTTRPTNQAAADRAAGHLAPPAPATDAAAGGDHVTAREITEFLHDLARIRSADLDTDPTERAALPARKTDLFTRIADQHTHTDHPPPSTTPPPTTPTAPEGRTP